MVLINWASRRRELNAAEHDGGHRDALSNCVVLTLRSVYFRSFELICPFTVVALTLRSIHFRVASLICYLLSWYQQAARIQRGRARQRPSRRSRSSNRTRTCRASSSGASPLLHSNIVHTIQRKIPYKIFIQTQLAMPTNNECLRLRRCDCISQKVFITLFCKSRFPHKFVNL